jgi:hypothetical protein
MSKDSLYDDNDIFDSEESVVVKKKSKTAPRIDSGNEEENLSQQKVFPKKKKRVRAECDDNDEEEKPKQKKKKKFNYDSDDGDNEDSQEDRRPRKYTKVF